QWVVGLQPPRCKRREELGPCRTSLLLEKPTRPSNRSPLSARSIAHTLGKSVSSIGNFWRPLSPSLKDGSCSSSITATGPLHPRLARHLVWMRVTSVGCCAISPTKD